MNKEKTWTYKMGYAIGFAIAALLMGTLLVGAFKLLLYVWYI